MKQSRRTWIGLWAFAKWASAGMVVGLAGCIYVGTASAQTVAAPAITNVDYAACQAELEEDFRRAVETITRKSLASGLANLDYAAVVRSEWIKSDLDDVIDKRVDVATAEVRDELSWASLLKSLAYRERAKELATAVAERVYRSDAVTDAISALSGRVGERIGQSIEVATIDAAGPAQRCVQAFLVRRYGSSVASAVEDRAAAEFRVDPGTGSAGIGTGRVLLENAGGLTGAVVLLVRRQLARTASRFGQRIVGAVLGRIVSVAAGGVGLALIAKDIWDLRHGMLPIIADEMKSAETKTNVQTELADSIAAQIQQQTQEIASETANRIVEIWKDFQRAHAKVLVFAEQDDAFRTFVDTVGSRNLARTDEVVALILASEGDAGVKKALADGTLHSAVTRMPEAAMTIAREQQSLAAGLKWSALAGERLDEVLDLGLHKRSEPDAFSAVSLRRLLALDNRAAKLRLAGMTPADRDILFELDNAKLDSLGRGLTDDELRELAGYLRGLDRDASQVVLEAVAASPAKMRILASERVRSAVLGSRDQVRAVEMLLRDGSNLDPGGVTRDVQSVLDGAVHPLLIWERHPIVVFGLVFVLLLVLLILRGILFGGRKPRAPKADGQKADSQKADGSAAA